MSRVFALCTALLAQVSASSFDWDSHVREDAGSHSKASAENGRAKEASAAERKAFRRAEAGIEELRSWGDRLEAELESKAAVFALAKGIAAKVESSYPSQCEDLKRGFRAALEDPDLMAAVTANSSDAALAEESAAAGTEELRRRWDRAEAKAMRSSLRAMEKAGKSKARALWKEAREAAHEAYRSGLAAARAQRSAGAREEAYERAEADSEEASELLLRSAEEAAERAEGLVEQQVGRVGQHLAKLMHVLHENEQHEREVCMQRLRHAMDLAPTAMEGSQQGGVKERAVKDMNTSDRTDSPGIFLAQASRRNFGNPLMEPLLWVSVGVAMLMLLVLHFCCHQGAIVTGRPLLG